MSGKRFRARAKTLQKLGRDGLVEKNMTTGEEKRVSQRTADISFGPDRNVEQAAGHRAAQRGGGSSPTPAKKRRKQPRPVQQTAQEAAYSTQAYTTQPLSSAPEIPIQDVPFSDTPSMRMAADAPMMSPVVTSEDVPPPQISQKQRQQKNRKKSNQQQAAKHTPDAARSLEDRPLRGAGDIPIQNRPPGEGQKSPTKRPPRPAEGGGRLNFESAAEEKPVLADAKAKSKKHQMRQFAPDAAQPAATVEQRPSRLMDDSGGRLNFERTAEEKPVLAGAEAKSKKKQQARRFVPDAAQPAVNGEQRPSRLMDDGGGRLHFEVPADHAAPVSEVKRSAETKRAVKKRQVMDYAAAAIKSEAAPVLTADGNADTRQQGNPQPQVEPPHFAPDDRAEYKKRQAAKFAGNSDPPISPERRRLQFEDEPPPKADSPPAPAPKQDATPKRDALPPNRKYDKAMRRVERAEAKVEQARENLPVKRRLSIHPEPDRETGKPRRRLHFEQEVLPEYRKPSLPARAGEMAKTAAVMKLHGKIHESERDNVAVEASHKSELVAEQGVGRALRWERNRRRSKPYRALRQAEQQAAKENVNLAWQTALRDNPELQRKHALAKWMQKQQIKRKYVQAAHEAKQAQHFTQNVLNAAGKIARSVQQYAAAHKSMLAVVALLAMVMVFFSAGITSCTAMLSGLQSSYISASYMADEQDICNADLYYTELETDLQIDIDKTEENYPGYDEYLYNIGEISHSPYELMGYLSTKFNAFTFAEVKAEIERLFGAQYQLTREVIDDNILQTTLTVRPLSDVIRASLTPGEETDRYGVYMQTLGNRQAFGNPFDDPWLGFVSSGYGYRVHPITGDKNLHRGVDIGADEGTPIKAIHDGRVVSAGEAEGYGLCIVIEDDKGYQSRYAHCSSLSVSVGQEVKRGDVIAAVGNTGQSTGPHLHLEVMLNGEYLNPYYFVDTGYDGTGTSFPGTPSNPVYSEYPGEPPTDEIFAAILAEAEKYLGYPYVWGGSTPETSFDCSGFVCWVVNHTGWSVGRTTAQGLYNFCTPVSPDDAKPGDLIFFQGTYATSDTVTHIGIYVGNGQMIHCGNPISYASINSSYWQQHFYSFGRLP